MKQMTQMKKTQKILEMSKRRGEACSQEWKGANDDGITGAEVKSSKMEDKFLQENLEVEERSRRHRGHAENIVRSHPSQNASSDSTRRYAADAQGGASSSSTTRHKGDNNVDARTARRLTPMRRPSPSPIRRRVEPNRRRCKGYNAGEKDAKDIGK